MVSVADGIRLGDPMAEDTEMGPICTPGQMDHIEAQLARAVAEGGRILTGGTRPEGLPGRYLRPTIVECPRQNMEIVDTELFGPVLAVQRFRDEEEALRLANDTKHGLAAGLFTRDSARSLRLARRIRAGIVWVNTYRVISPIAEFGGIKTSGHGRESGLQALRDYTRTKTVWMNVSDTPVANPFQPR
jgi:aldehyde dehydrogenase (NAD+)